MAKKKSSEVAEAMGVDLGPSLYLNDRNYDGIDKLTVGQEVTMTITGKVSSVSENEYEGSEKHCNASIRIKKINDKNTSSAEIDDED